MLKNNLISLGEDIIGQFVRGFCEPLLEKNHPPIVVLAEKPNDAQSMRREFVWKSLPETFLVHTIRFG